MKYISNFAILLFLPCFLFSDSISISGNPTAFTFSSAVAGSNPVAQSNTNAKYSYSTTTGLARRITGALNTAAPTGVTIKIQLTAGASATSTGLLVMTTTAQNLITGIPQNVSGSSLSITCNVSVTVAAAQVSGGTRNLTLTITI